jgi:hypothetical protein
MESFGVPSGPKIPYQHPSQQKSVNFLRKLQCFSGHVLVGHF